MSGENMLMLRCMCSYTITLNALGTAPNNETRLEITQRSWLAHDAHRLLHEALS